MSEPEQTLTERKPQAEEPESMNQQVTEYEEKGDGTAGTERAGDADDRDDRFIEGAIRLLPDWMEKYVRMLAPVVRPIAAAVAFIWPYLCIAYSFCEKYYKMLPEFFPQMIYGILVCFMGAHFAAIVTVIEAFKQSGAWIKLRACLVDLYEAFEQLRKENEKDNTIDADHDGILDVDELDPDEIFKHKMQVFFRAVNPDDVKNALEGLYQGFVSMVLVVRFSFAKTVALGNSIADNLLRVTDFVLEPVLDRILAEEYHPWIMLIISYICKTIGVTLAWALQFYQSLVQCAIAGGLTFSRNLIAYLNKAGKIQINMEESFLDEIVGWGLAFFSLIFQFSTGFHLLFPFNFLFFPLRAFEWTLRGYAASGQFADPDGEANTSDMFKN